MAQHVVRDGVHVASIGGTWMANGTVASAPNVVGLDGALEHLVAFLRNDPDARDRSVLAAPLMLQDEPLGVLMLESAHLGTFHEGDVESLEAVADICATAIQNAHYVERVKQLAYLDGLTGIFNRRHFGEVLARDGFGAAMLGSQLDGPLPVAARVRLTDSTVSR